MDGNLHAQHIQMGFRQPIFAALSQNRRYAIMGSDTSRLIEHLKLLEKFYSSLFSFNPYLGSYSIRSRYFYLRDTFDCVLNYGEKVWDIYKNEKKFLRVTF